MRAVVKALVMVIALLPCMIAYGQEAELKKLNDEVARLCQQGKYAEAVTVAQQSLQLAEKSFGPNHPQTANSLNSLAFLYDSQRKYVEAEPLYRRAIAISEKSLGPDNPQTATLLNNLAEMYRAQGKYVEAEPLYKRALGACRTEVCKYPFSRPVVLKKFCCNGAVGSVER